MSDKPKDLRKLCIMNLTESQIDRVLNECREFSDVVNYSRFAKSGSSISIFPSFRSEKDATTVKNGLTKRGYNVNYANMRTGAASTSNAGAAAAAVVAVATTPIDLSADFSKDRPYGICIRCGDKAYYNCGRCDDFYCSVDCQSIDWSVHKLTCIPMPELVPAKIPKNSKAMENAMENLQLNGSTSVHENSAAETSANDVKLGHQSSEYSNGNDSVPETYQSHSESIENDSNVLITYARNYQCVYIRNCSADDEFRDLMNDVAEAALVAPNLRSYPRPKQDTVLAPYEGFYYRGLVIACNECAGLVRVGFLDFGNNEEVPFSELKVLPAELSQRPRLVIMVKLKNMVDNPSAEKALAMEKYLEKISDLNESVVLKVRGDGDRIVKNDSVELFDVKANRSINQQLNEML